MPEVNQLKVSSSSGSRFNVREWWPLIVAAVTVILAFGALQSTAREHDRRITSIEVRQEQITRDISLIKETTAAIDARLDFIVDYLRQN